MSRRTVAKLSRGHLGSLKLLVAAAACAITGPCGLLAIRLVDKLRCECKAQCVSKQHDDDA
jgi:hypothetical protein